MAVAKSGSNVLRIAGGGGVISISGGVDPSGHGYTVTHYVAPFASVSGATSDGQNISAGSYSSATNSATPTTLGTAFARASAGHIIELAPGTYSAEGGSGEDEAAFSIGVNGSAGNPIIFCAEYPATHNDSNRSKIRNTDASSVVSGRAPVIKMNTYCIIDGLWFDYADGGLPSTRGVCATGFGTTNVGFRRLRFDRTDLGSDDDGDNYGCLHLRGTNTIEVSNCKFLGGFSGTASENEACVETYGARNVTIEHCEFDDVATGFYIKGTDGTYGSNGVIRYNKLKNVGQAFRMLCGAYNTAGQMEIYQNLIYQDGTHDGWSSGFYMDNFVSQLEDFHIYNNTIDAPADASEGTIMVNGNGGAGSNNRFRNNIAVYRVTTSQVNFNAQRALTDFATADLDYNWYYENGNTVQYYLNPTTHNGIAAWRTALGSSKEANSQEGNPQFTNAASGDYTLQVGSGALTASSTGGPVGCYITGSEEIGVEAAPSY
jgi:hypothetical protein